MGSVGRIVLLRQTWPPSTRLDDLEITGICTDIGLSQNESHCCRGRIATPGHTGTWRGGFADTKYISDMCCAISSLNWLQVFFTRQWAWMSQANPSCSLDWTAGQMCKPHEESDVESKCQLSNSSK